MICSDALLHVIRAAGVLAGAGACDSNNTKKEGYKHHNLIHRHLTHK